MIAQTHTYRVEAYNISHASENKIHDDTVAKKLGFTGGLVPGVEMFAYLSNVAVQKWGMAWLEHGRLECRFGKPLYDGHMAEVSGVGGDSDSDSEMALTLTSDGVECATGKAWASGDRRAPPIDAYQQATPPELSARPPASEASLAKGTWLGIRPFVMTQQLSNEYLANIKEALPLYSQHGLAHPGLLLRQCNTVLRENVLLAPWIHVGSDVQNFSPVRVGEEVSVRARVTDNYDRKGHRLVDLDCIIIAAGKRVAAHVKHSAIYKLRHLQG
ncbi:MAG: hotdog fold domain-containing protein [Hyphomicrobiaceae bacterium]